MISLVELQEAAKDWGLPLTTVERDYVLGWMLWGIGSQEEIKDKWIFKGGTCLKKCFMETWRFSEDLDFSLLPDSPFDVENLQKVITASQLRIHNESGIDFSIAPPFVKLRPGHKAAEGRIYFRSLTGMSHPLSIKLDLTIAEPIITPPVPRKIQHGYRDSLPAPTEVLCYSFSELFAEKIRAMGERARPRDLYDIINLFWRREADINRDEICKVLEKKCNVKNIPTVTFETISVSPFLPELQSEWGNMLAHQLKELPPYDHFWNALPEFFNWLHGLAEITHAPSLRASEAINASWIPPAAASHWNGVPLETIRFAAANHLCIKLGYDGRTRLVEPYALRQTREGNIILTAIRVEDRENRSYRIDRIESAEVTQIPFTPIYAIEIGATGQLETPPIIRKSSVVPRYKIPPLVHAKTLKPRTRSFGPTYIFECSFCQKQVRKKTYDTSLRAHKMKGQDFQCQGRRGWHVKTVY